MFPIRTQAQRVAHVFMFPCVQHRAGMESRDLACPCRLSTCPGLPLVPCSFSASAGVKLVQKMEQNGRAPKASPPSCPRGQAQDTETSRGSLETPMGAREDQAKSGNRKGWADRAQEPAFLSENGFPSWARLYNLWNPAQNTKSLRMSWWPLQNINSVWTQCHHGGSPMKPALSVLSRAVRWYMSGTGACREKSLEPAWLSCQGLCKVSPLISQDFGSLIYKMGMITGPLWKLSQFMCAWLGTSHGKICYWCLPTPSSRVKIGLQLPSSHQGLPSCAFQALAAQEVCHGGNPGWVSSTSSPLRTDRPGNGG